MSDPYSHSQPYSTGRGFVHLTSAESKELRKEREFRKGGLGIRYNEWAQLPNATGEVMRGVSSNYDWRNYTAKPITGFSEVAPKDRKFGPPQQMWRAAKQGYQGTVQGASEPEDSSTPTWGSSRESTSSGLSSQQTSLFADTTPTEGYQGYEPPKGGMGARA